MIAIYLLKLIYTTTTTVPPPGGSVKYEVVPPTLNKSNWIRSAFFVPVVPSPSPTTDPERQSESDFEVESEFVSSSSPKPLPMFPPRSFFCCLLTNPTILAAVLFLLPRERQARV